MNMQTKIRAKLLAGSIAVGLLAASGMGASAYGDALPSGTILTMTAGGGTVIDGDKATLTPAQIINTYGSYFVMGQNSYKPGLVGLVPGTGPGLVLGGTTVNGQGVPLSTALNAKWLFFGAPGYNRIDTTVNDVNSTAPSDNGNGTLNMGAWTVNWSGGDVDMSSGAPATFTCSGGVGNCANGDTYTLHYEAIVPSGNFKNVQYDLYLAGKLSVPGPGTPPLTQPYTANVTGPTVLHVLTKDVDADGLNPHSVKIGAQPTSGSIATANSDGTITYTPNPTAFTNGTDTFTYTVADILGAVSAPTTVTVTVAQNVPPVANNDAATVSAGGTVTINVTANDTDANDNLDPSTVAIVTYPSNGTLVNNKNGTVTYKNNGAVGPDSFTYTVADTLGAVSNVATVNINVSAFPGTAPTSWNSTTGEIPVLFFTSGVAGDSGNAVPSGSYFGMQMSPTNMVYTPLERGPDGGIAIGVDQAASGSHTGAPNGTATPGIDQPWSFFGNTGLSYTKNGGITVNSDGTLNFSNRWFVTWNGIPAINMGGCTGSTCPAGASDLGKASIACTPSPCEDGSSFVLNYAAHVPLGDPSGFGGVPYTLHMVGTVGVMHTALQSAGTLAAGPYATAAGSPSGRVTAAQLTKAGIQTDTGVTESCVGGCFDFTITGLTGSSTQVVLPLTAGVPDNAVYRKYLNGQWQDLPSTDTIQSAPYTPGTGTCPAPGNKAYRTLTAGDYCLELTLPVSGGSVSDPGGLAVVASAASTTTGTRPSGSSGCSIDPNPVAPGNGGAWLIVGGFVAWLGVGKHRRSRRSNRSAR